MTFATPRYGSGDYAVGTGTWTYETSKYTARNDGQYALVWQVFRVESCAPNCAPPDCECAWPSAWTNLCGPSGPDSLQPNCDVRDASTGAIYLGAGETSFFYLDPGNTYIQRAWACAPSAPNPCPTASCECVYDFECLADEECRDYTCQTSCVSHTGAQCLQGTPTYVNSCGVGEDAKEERCATYGLTCRQTAPRTGVPLSPLVTDPTNPPLGSSTPWVTPPTQDAWCVNPNDPSISLITFVNPEDESQYCVKTSGLTGAQSCASFAFPRKPATPISALESVGPSSTWDDPTSPVCRPELGEAQCQPTGTCLRAAKPEACPVVKELLGLDCVKSEAEKVYAVLHDRSSGDTIGGILGGAAGLGAAFIINPAAWVGVGLVAATAWVGDHLGDAIDDRTITDLGVCVPRRGGGGGLNAWAEKLGISQVTLLWIIIAIAAVLLLPSILPRRNA